MTRQKTNGERNLSAPGRRNEGSEDQAGNFKILETEVERCGDGGGKKCLSFLGGGSAVSESYSSALESIVIPRYYRE